jgi:hypothetical protein
LRPQSISHARGLALPTRFARRAGEAAVVVAAAVEYIGSMASVPEIAIPDWQVAVSCLVRRESVTDYR